MKKQIKGKATTASFFDAPEIKKIMNDPVRRASIEAKSSYIELLENMARLRKKSHIPQPELARITKISQPELSRIERGKRNITLDTYFRYVNAVGYRPEIIYHKIHRTHA